MVLKDDLNNKYLMGKLHEAIYCHQYNVQYQSAFI